MDLQLYFAGEYQLLSMSLVWDNFEICKKDNAFTICILYKYVEAKVSRGQKKENFNTSNMRTHLHNHHPKEYNDMIEKEQQVNNSIKKNIHTQLTLNQALKRTQVFPDNSSTAKEITEALGNLIVGSNLPFRIVEENSFINLLYLLEPRYKLPGRKYFSEEWFNIEVITRIIQKIDYVCTTTDIWTSKANDRFISLTVHWINEEFQRRDIQLEIQQQKNEQNSENFLKEIDSYLNKWELQDKCQYIVMIILERMKQLSEKVNIKIKDVQHITFKQSSTIQYKKQKVYICYQFLFLIFILLFQIFHCFKKKMLKYIIIQSQVQYWMGLTVKGLRRNRINKAQISLKYNNQMELFFYDV